SPDLIATFTLSTARKLPKSAETLSRSTPPFIVFAASPPVCCPGLPRRYRSNPPRATTGRRASGETQRPAQESDQAAFHLSASSPRSLMNQASCVGHHHSFCRASPGKDAL